MASESPICSICELQNISKPSEIWCSECEESFCADCNKPHSLSKGTRNHQTVPIKEYQKLPANVLQISLFCSDHNEKYQMFCKRHDCPCCRWCIKESHNECKDIEVIDNVIKNVKSSAGFLDMENSLADLAENIVKLREDREQNLKSLRESRYKIECEIKQTRMKINNHLDQVEKDIMNKLEIIEDSQIKKIGKTLSQLEQNEAEIGKCSNTMQTIKQHASDLQTFLTMKQLESEVMRNEHAIKSMYDNDGMKQIDLSCKFDKSLLTLSDVIKSFGEIIVDSKPNEVTITTQKDKEAQIILPHVLPPSIDQISLHLEQTVNTMASVVSGCTVLPDGCMVFADYTSTPKNKVNFVRKNGSEAFSVEVDSAFDVVYIEEDNTVAVTSGGSISRCVNIIDIKKRKVTKTIRVGSDIYGADIKGHNLIFSAGRKGIRMLNLTDETVCDILKTRVGCYITLFGDNLYFSSSINNTVTCCDVSGTIQCKFKKESLLKNSKGITVDSYGNLYVVGNGSSNVVMISPDEQRYRQILSSEDGLLNPKALHFDKLTNKLLVANAENSAFLFRIKS